jgi:hypothetical protein
MIAIVKKFSKLNDEKRMKNSVKCFVIFLMNNSVRYFYADRNRKYFCNPLYAVRSVFWQINEKCNFKMCNPCHMFKPSICILDFNHALRLLRSDSRLPSATHPYSGAWRLRACRIRVDCRKPSLETDPMPMCVLMYTISM